MYGSLSRVQAWIFFQFSVNVWNTFQGSGNVLGSIAPAVAPPAADASLDPKQVSNVSNMMAGKVHVPFQAMVDEHYHDL